jgi:glutamate-1-semialdehyde 2,1-aminomutase
MTENSVPSHLIRIGKIIGEGLRSTAEKYELNLTTRGIPPLTTFSFDYCADSQALITLFTQEMLNRGFLASKSIYVSFSHSDECVEEYLAAVEEVFGKLKEAVEGNKMKDLLHSPVAHEGFKRLN